MDNRRKEMRKKMMAFTPVYNERGNVLGYLGNLTMQGAMVIGEKPFEINARMALDIEFLDELPGGLARRLIIAARVARCSQDAESDHEYQIGFEFEEPTPAQAIIIQALLDRYHFRYRSWAKDREAQ